MESQLPVLILHKTPGASVEEVAPGNWVLSLPAGPGGKYRWAQLDDYLQRSRSDFIWQPPLSFSLRARVSSKELPGTWGFGLWNDPFNVSLGLGGTARRLPALPNAAWYFYASSPNYLSMRDDLPAQGMLMAAFSALPIPSLLLALGLPFLPLAAFPPTAHFLRQMARVFIKQDAAQLAVDTTDWHSYHLDWLSSVVRFSVDEQHVFETRVVPQTRMGFVLWIDNQYAAFPPKSTFKLGTLASPTPAWLEITDLSII